MARLFMLGLALVAAGSGAAAADDERSLSATVSYAYFSTLGEPPEEGAEPPALSPDFGGSLSLAYERMLGTDLGLRGSVTGGAFSGGQQMDQSSTSFALLGDVGVVFKLDILKYVPYGFAGVGGVLSGGGPIDNGLDFVVVVGGGLDYLVTRQRSFGLEVRLASFGGDVTVMTAGIRGTTRWGFF